MKRPVGVSIIACWCLMAGVYLCSIAAMKLVAPHAVVSLRPAPLVRALRVANPYFTLGVGVTWAIIAWGIFQMRNWGRIAAQILFGFGAFWEAQSLTLQSLILHPRSIWLTLLSCLEIILRLLAVMYLVSDTVREAFRQEAYQSPTSIH